MNSIQGQIHKNNNSYVLYDNLSYLLIANFIWVVLRYK